jgi:hypothetical protein
MCLFTLNIAPPHVPLSQKLGESFNLSAVKAKIQKAMANRAGQ